MCEIQNLNIFRITLTVDGETAEITVEGKNETLTIGLLHNEWEQGGNLKIPHPKIKRVYL